MKNYSILDLSPIVEGGSAKQSLENTIALAKLAEAEGYHRYWMAEHHAMPGVASAATSVLVGAVAANTQSIRVGAGGVMLPNHAPLVIAEQFGTLATLYPDRIDLGLGRAPGTDGPTAKALRRYFESADQFPEDVIELMGYLDDAKDDAPVKAVPGQGTHVPIWILGSSLFGASLAAHLGLPYAFASHFAPDMMSEALKAYRENFRPSKYLAEPYVMIAVNVFGADSEEEARYLMSSQQQGFALLRSGKPSPLPRPVEDVQAVIPPAFMAGIDNALSVSAVGTAQQVREDLRQIIERHQPDEVMVTGMMHDAKAAQKSFKIAAGALRELSQKAAA